MILPNNHKLTGRLFNPAMALANIEGRKTDTRRALNGKNLEQIKLQGLNDDPEIGYSSRYGTYSYEDEEGQPKLGPEWLLDDEEYVYPIGQCPWGIVGDWFYQKETFMYSDVQVSWDDDEPSTAQVLYKASNDIRPDGVSVEDFGAAKWITVSTEKAEDIEDNIDSEEQEGESWKPSIHMPFEAARFFGQIIEIRIERLHDITDEGAIAEGIEILSTEQPLYRDYLRSVHTRHLYGFYNPIYSYQSLWKKINGTDSWQQNPFVFVIKYKGHTREQFEAAVGTTCAELAKQIKRKGGAV